jgi:putative tryptophan/tyrosine transport system substrate-binding protein
MRRREFIALAGCAVVASPFAAHAQQMPVVGFLDAGSPTERASQVAPFRKGLAEGGYQEGQNVAIEARWRLRPRQQRSRSCSAQPAIR